VSERQVWRRHVAAVSLNERLSCVIFVKGESYGWMIFRGPCRWVPRMPETAVRVTYNSAFVGDKRELP
jgi:hypothetical protein